MVNGRPCEPLVRQNMFCSAISSKNGKTSISEQQREPSDYNPTDRQQQISSSLSNHPRSISYEDSIGFHCKCCQARRAAERSRLGDKQAWVSDSTSASADGNQPGGSVRVSYPPVWSLSSSTSSCQLSACSPTSNSDPRDEVDGLSGRLSNYCAVCLRTTRTGISGERTACNAKFGLISCNSSECSSCSCSTCFISRSSSSSSSSSPSFQSGSSLGGGSQQLGAAYSTFGADKLALAKSQRVKPYDRFGASIVSCHCHGSARGPFCRCQILTSSWGQLVGVGIEQACLSCGAINLNPASSLPPSAESVPVPHPKSRGKGRQPRLTLSSGCSAASASSWSLAAHGDNMGALSLIHSWRRTMIDARSLSNDTLAWPHSTMSPLGQLVGPIIEPGHHLSLRRHIWAKNGATRVRGRRSMSANDTPLGGSNIDDGASQFSDRQVASSNVSVRQEYNRLALEAHLWPANQGASGEQSLQIVALDLDENGLDGANESGKGSLVGSSSCSRKLPDNNLNSANSRPPPIGSHTKRSILSSNKIERQIGQAESKSRGPSPRGEGRLASNSPPAARPSQPASPASARQELAEPQAEGRSYSREREPADSVKLVSDDEPQMAARIDVRGEAERRRRPLGAPIRQPSRSPRASRMAANRSRRRRRDEERAVGHRLQGYLGVAAGQVEGAPLGYEKTKETGLGGSVCGSPVHRNQIKSFYLQEFLVSSSAGQRSSNVRLNSDSKGEAKFQLDPKDEDDEEQETLGGDVEKLAENLYEFAQRSGCVHCHCRHQLLMLVRNEQILKRLTMKIKQGSLAQSVEVESTNLAQMVPSMDCPSAKLKLQQGLQSSPSERLNLEEREEVCRCELTPRNRVHLRQLAQSWRTIEIDSGELNCDLLSAINVSMTQKQQDEGERAQRSGGEVLEEEEFCDRRGSCDDGSADNENGELDDAEEVDVCKQEDLVDEEFSVVGSELLDLESGNEEAENEDQISESSALAISLSSSSSSPCSSATMSDILATGSEPTKMADIKSAISWRKWTRRQVQRANVDAMQQQSGQRTLDFCESDRHLAAVAAIVSKGSVSTSLADEDKRRNRWHCLEAQSEAGCQPEQRAGQNVLQRQRRLAVSGASAGGNRKPAEDPADTWDDELDRLAGNSNPQSSFSAVFGRRATPTGAGGAGAEWWPSQQQHRTEALKFHRQNSNNPNLINRRYYRNQAADCNELGDYRGHHFSLRSLSTASSGSFFAVESPKQRVLKGLANRDTESFEGTRMQLVELSDSYSRSPTSQQETVAARPRRKAVDQVRLDSATMLAFGIDPENANLEKQDFLR